MPLVQPGPEYRARLERHQKARDHWQQRHRLLGNARVFAGLAAVAVAGISIGGGWISPWWLLIPAFAFLGLAIALTSIERSLDAAGRAVTYYQRALARVENRWAGGGHQGERFRNPQHLYADDLDVFGRGSLFELLSTNRTAAGERFLAGWLLAAGDRDDVVARQCAVEELRPRIDLREEIAVMGEEIRAAADDRTLKEWGEKPPVRVFKGARLIAPVLAAGTVITFVLFMAEIANIVPLLVAILADMAYGLAVREPVGRIGESMETPARELELLALLLKRLERETFTSPALVRLRQSLQTEGKPASRHIERLTRLVHHFDSTRNQFFRAIAAPLIWTPQFAMAIEAWRTRCGPQIGEWMAAVGEFEALCSLACFAYERPGAVFPELTAESIDAPEHIYEAVGLAHPLIPPERSVANNVSLGGGMRLWIISGSNMSGKSTLLRAIGLNAVLAWAGAPVMASSLRVSRFAIGASISTHDSLSDHRSRFYAEISRLREIVDLARAGKPTLFLLDELLSGTNSHDRRIGAEAIIRSLVERGAVGLVTTHDLALAEIVASFGGRAANVHFEDHLEGGEIRFDYRLRQGVVTRSNALELMRAVGLEV
ncbi:MAG TPA: hypothetical protein VGG72_00755 [Bryobacteraceae bacterium]